MYEGILSWQKGPSDVARWRDVRRRYRFWGTARAVWEFRRRGGGRGVVQDHVGRRGVGRGGKRAVRPRRHVARRCVVEHGGVERRSTEWLRGGLGRRRSVGRRGAAGAPRRVSAVGKRGQRGCDDGGDHRRRHDGGRGALGLPLRARGCRVGRRRARRRAVGRVRLCRGVDFDGLCRLCGGFGGGGCAGRGEGRVGAIHAVVGRRRKRFEAPEHRGRVRGAELVVRRVGSRVPAAFGDCDREEDLEETKTRVRRHERLLPRVCVVSIRSAEAERRVRRCRARGPLDVGLEDCVAGRFAGRGDSDDHRLKAPAEPDEVPR
mmetsp:Transcript_13143/g.43890  ORF Transcript_13143/g.43890 Transcript_13143/m.43890 type:complete len:319 (+) Transcript_13143:24-980(+)